MSKASADLCWASRFFEGFEGFGFKVYKGFRV